jgi:hypothetical protein
MTARAFAAVARAILRASLTAVVLLVAVLGSSASAANRQRLRVGIVPLAGKAATGSRPIALTFDLNRFTDEGVISSPAASDTFTLPRGFAVHPQVVPFCNIDLLAHTGPSACRRAVIGSGALRLSALTGRGTLPAAGRITIYNTPPVRGHPTTLTYAQVAQPVRSQFWFQGILSPTRTGAVLRVREVRLNVSGLPLTVVELNFRFGRTVGRGARRQSYLTGPATCGTPASRVFGLSTTFYTRVINFSVDRPAGPPIFTSEPASC